MDSRRAFENEICIPVGQHAIRGYIQVPNGPGPWPAVVVLHDALGQTDDSRRHVDWLANSGYIALAPDLYSRGSTTLCVMSMFRNLLTREGFAFETIDASRNLLCNRTDCTGKVAIIGFCMGGGFALIAAGKGDFQAASLNYGMVPKDADELLRHSCPIIGSFGAHDPTLKGAAMRLTQSLRTNGIAHDVKEYADTGHAFMNIHTGLRGWLVARLGMTFHGPSADDAQKRILAFFQTHLHDRPNS